MDMTIISTLPENIPIDLLLLADPSEHLISEYLTTGQCYAALHQGRIIGVVVTLLISPNTLAIKNLAVEEAFQGQGIGKQLITHVLELARQKNLSVEIGTGNSSIQQLALYQKCGFRMVSIDFDFFRRNYPEKIYENGIECRDMIRLRKDN